MLDVDAKETVLVERC